jgi:hypothetical protein
MFFVEALTRGHPCAENASERGCRNDTQGFEAKAEIPTQRCLLRIQVNLLLFQIPSVLRVQSDREAQSTLVAGRKQ